MERTKQMLNISVAFGIVMLSLSAFIYSIRDSKAYAAPETTSDGYIVTGVIQGTDRNWYVIGFNPKHPTDKVKALGRMAGK